MSVLIKDYGNNTECSNLSALTEALKNKYKNSSVSIVDKMPSGITGVKFVDVQSDGSLIDTYTKEVISINSFNF